MSPYWVRLYTGLFVRVDGLESSQQATARGPLVWCLYGEDGVVKGQDQQPLCHASSRQAMAAGDRVIPLRDRLVGEQLR